MKRWIARMEECRNDGYSNGRKKTMEKKRRGKGKEGRKVKEEEREAEEGVREGVQGTLTAHVVCRCYRVASCIPS